MLSLCDAGYSTYLLGKWVRERQALSLEAAVRRLTSVPADFFGIRSRGRLSPGLAADIVVFDPTMSGSPLRGEMVSDLPGGGRRLVTRSQGIEYTMVNGEVMFRSGKPLETLAGKVLRSGVD